MIQLIKIYYYVGLGIYNKDDSINDTIKNKLRVGLVALKNELDLDIKYR